MDQGELEAAKAAFQDADVNHSWDPYTLTSAMRLYGLLGNAQEAERLFQRVSAMGNTMSRTGDLRIRLQVDPQDSQAAAEIGQLQSELTAHGLANFSHQRSVSATCLNGADCICCTAQTVDGENGNGDGRGARHLFPYPRNLRREKSRLISTRNGVPTLQDTITVLRRGIPGTAMPAYDDLTDSQLRLLAEEVHALRRDGLREQYLEELAYYDDPVDDQDVKDFVVRMSTPGEVIEVPAMPPPTEASLRRGKELFIQQACHSCHGDDGRGLPNQVWYDERGFPVRTRDLAYEPLKGSQDAQAVYLRVAAGMPGTPHPANTTLDQQQLTDVVQYCLSLSREPKVHLTNFQRAELASGRDYVMSQTLPGDSQ